MVLGWLSRRLGLTKPAPLQPVDFIAIDVETANGDRHSICQIGVVAFHQGVEVFSKEVLVNPRCAFAPGNIQIHGITARHVHKEPDFGRLHAPFEALLRGHVLVAHSRFDQEALTAACRRFGRPPIEARWLDTVNVARVAWPHLENHKLPTVAAEIGHSFRHHAAGDDARAAGQVLLRAIAETGHPLESWLDGSAFPPRARSPRPVAAPAGEGPLSGHCVVLTGDFSVPKSALAADLAAAGALVVGTVSRKVTIVATGERDAALYGGSAKSGKQGRAEELIAQGAPIAIITEAELRRMLAPAA